MSRRIRQISSSDEEDQTPFDDETVRILGMEENEDDNIEGEELINDNMERDYRPIPELDVYEEAGLDDDSSVAELSDTARFAAEDELNRRDRTEGRQGAMRRGYIPDIFDEESSDLGLAPRQHRTHEEGESQAYEPIENLENTRGMSVKEWIQQPATRQEIRYRFLSFIRTHLTEQGNSEYAELLRKMAQDNMKSVVVNYEHLVHSSTTLAYFLPESPKEMLEIFDEVAYEVTLELYPRYQHITNTIHVRIKNLPLKEDLRDLRSCHLGQMVRTNGIVSSCNNVLPQLKQVKYNCIKCNCLMGPFLYTGEDSENKPKSCPDCQSRGPFDVNIQSSSYRNYQKIVVEECPGTVPGGRIPRNVTVILTEDLVNYCKPGDEVDVTGSYEFIYDRTLNNKQRFPIFATHIFANYIEKKDSVLAFNSLNDDDIKKLKLLSKDNNLFNRIVRSIAPSIFGHDNIKRAIALSLFGGVAKKSDSHKLRGDINILLCGDPGTGKSQFLKFVQKLSPRCIFTTGQGASAVGLTANVTRNSDSKEFTLEAGALVLADNGVCLIDEFDKMNDRDRTSIHEAMEQQTISISKAGIVSTLQARTTIIAAANPIGGHYDINRTFSDNVDLTSPILSRFDVICVVRNNYDKIQRRMLVRYVAGMHMLSRPRNTDEEREEIKNELKSRGHLLSSTDSEIGELEPIPLEMLQKYIIYAKGKVNPRLDDATEKRFPSIYSELRRVSLSSGGLDVTMRYLESMVRLAEAHARIHLREVINEDDVNMAVRICLESFISTEKNSVKRLLEKKLDRHLSYKRSDNELLSFILRQIVQEMVASRGTSRLTSMADEERIVEIPEKKLIERARNINVEIIRAFLTKSFFTQYFSYDSGQKIIYYKY